MFSFSSELRSDTQGSEDNIILIFYVYSNLAACALVHKTLLSVVCSLSFWFKFIGAL